MSETAKKLSRTEIADRIATEARVFVRRARREGHSNKITEQLLWETVEVLGYDETDFSMKTVKRLALEDARLMDEIDLIDF